MMIATPCVKRCGLDEATGLCLGCGRTLAEIMDWSAMTETERLRVMMALPNRMSGEGGETSPLFHADAMEAPR